MRKQHNKTNSNQLENIFVVLIMGECIYIIQKIHVAATLKNDEIGGVHIFFWNSPFKEHSTHWSGRIVLQSFSETNTIRFQSQMFKLIHI